MNLILKPSKIHGVGVFAVKPIKLGKVISLFAFEDWRWIGNPLGLERRFCTKEASGAGFYGPKNWNRMSIGWYLNESKHPNVQSRFGSSNWLSIRYIKAGEELTIDYSGL